MYLKEIKIKPLTKEQLIISIDRLTRFKNTKEKYFRVFCDLLVNNLVFPKYKKVEIDNIPPEKLKNYAQNIINYSLEILGFKNNDDYKINQKLLKYEDSVFVLDDYTKVLLSNEIDYKSFINLTDENSVKNLKWLKSLDMDCDIEQKRCEQGFQFPIKEIIIVEGATEEILLPEFAKICGYDFDKMGIFVLSAGGKNQVVKLYYKLCEKLKIPIFVLLDKDALDNLKEIEPKLRPIDKIHLLQAGEFEDLLPLDLVKRTLEYELNNISVIEKDILETKQPKAKILEEVFKTRGMHEFKKAEFARLVKKNIKNQTDVSDEIFKIINEIKIRNLK